MWKLLGREIKLNYTRVIVFGIAILSLSTAVSMFVKKQEVQTTFVPVIKEKAASRKVIDSLLQAREMVILDSMSRLEIRLRREIRGKNRIIDQLIKKHEAFRNSYDSIYIDRPVF